MSRRARVLEISGYPPPFGGWTMRTAQLKARLEDEGHVCVVLNIGDTRRIPSPHYETVSSARDFVRKVWRFSRRGFLVHTHANGEALKGLVLALAAQIIARIAGQPSVLTFHAGVDQLYFPRHRAPHWVPLFRLLFATARQIICNAAEVKALIVDYGVADDRIVVIPAFSRQYVHFSHVALPPPLSDHFARWPSSLFSYLTMRRTYDPEVLIDGFARVAWQRELGLVVCGLDGHTEPDVAARFHERIRHSGLADRICLVGSLEHDAFLTAMTRCRLYIRMPVSDGVCSSVLEALTLGVPVVASQNHTRPSGVVTFAAGDAIDLARAVIAALDADSPSSARTPVDAIPDTVSVETALLVDRAGVRIDDFAGA